MSINKNEIISNNEDSGTPPDLIMTDLSRDLLDKIESILDDLIKHSDLYPSDDEFYYKFHKILEFYDLYQNEVLSTSGISIVCDAGCSYCCCHWVEDVNSFEAEIIKRYLKENHSGMIESIAELFSRDADVLASLRLIVEEKTAEDSTFSSKTDDSYDLLLSCFYQLDRPCALLDQNGCCIIYPVRPLTCRDYLNLLDPEMCHPEWINEDKNATLIMYLPETVLQKLEILHRRFDDGSNNMSLRSLLLRHLV